MYVYVSGVWPRKPSMNGPCPGVWRPAYGNYSMRVQSYTDLDFGLRFWILKESWGPPSVPTTLRMRRSTGRVAQK